MPGTARECPPDSPRSSRSAVIVSDTDGFIRTWGERAAEVFGYAQDEILGRPESALFTPEDRASGAAERDRVEALRDGGIVGLRWYVHRDGGRLWGNAALVPLPGPDGRPAGFVRVLRDETRSQLLLDQLEQRDVRLVESDRQKDLFLATLAHEIKNPLQTIRMGLSLLRESRDNDAEFAEWSGLIDSQVDAIFRTVNDLSDLARIAAGKVELRRERLAARRVMEQAIESAREVVASRRHRLANAAPPADVCVTGDPQRLRQVFVNLLSNAAKYTPEGGEIEFAAGVEGGDVAFRIRDNGVGISPETLPRVFDAFYQADAQAEGAHGGLGLGLAIVRKLVALHGGTVEARSEGLGRGSEFVVRLPYDGG
ncbi:MAG TPA: PAS domain-containing sensor histidine kinase [Planctomycetaceae bacterium]